MAKPSWSLVRPFRAWPQDAFFLGLCPRLEWLAPLGLTDQGNMLQHLVVQSTSVFLGQDLLS